MKYRYIYIMIWMIYFKYVLIVYNVCIIMSIYNL